MRTSPMSFHANSFYKRYPAVGPAALLLGVVAALVAYGNVTSARNDAMLAKDLRIKQEVLFPEEREVYAGERSARVVVLEYFDLECPYCREYHRGGEAHLRAIYKNQSVAFARRHMPLTYLHKNALVKAQVLECALLMQPQAYELASSFLYETPFIGTSTLVAGLAAAMKTDAAFMEKCVADGATLGKIAADRALAGIHGISVTPTCVIYKDGVERGRVTGNRTSQVDSGIRLLLTEDGDF